jgi:hypothetical protein
MKRVILALGLVCLVAAVAFAQAKPNFAGKWTLDTAKSELGGGGGGRGGGGPMTVTQTDKQLTVERTMGENTVKSVYNLDGTESVNEVSMRGNTMKQASTAKWDGAKLVITTKFEGPNGPIEQNQTWSMADGNLVIEQQGRGGMTKRVYTKG